MDDLSYTDKRTATENGQRYIAGALDYSKENNLPTDDASLAKLALERVKDAINYELRNMNDSVNAFDDHLTYQCVVVKYHNRLKHEMLAREYLRSLSV